METTSGMTMTQVGSGSMGEGLQHAVVHHEAFPEAGSSASLPEHPCPCPGCFAAIDA